MGPGDDVLAARKRLFRTTGEKRTFRLKAKVQSPWVRPRNNYQRVVALFRSLYCLCRGAVHSLKAGILHACFALPHAAQNLFFSGRQARIERIPTHSLATNLLDETVQAGNLEAQRDDAEEGSMTGSSGSSEWSAEGATAEADFEDASANVEQSSISDVESEASLGETDLDPTNSDSECHDDPGSSCRQCISDEERSEVDHDDTLADIDNDFDQCSISDGESEASLEETDSSLHRLNRFDRI